MTNSNVITNEKGPTKTVEKAVPLNLKSDKAPELSADLKANGHDLRGVGDVEAKTINGTDYTEELKAFDKKVEVWVTGNFAPLAHSHQEVSDLRKRVDALTAAQEELSKKKCSQEGHTHTLAQVSGTLSLERVEHGAELLALLKKESAPLQHTHPDLAKSIDSAAKATAQLQGIVSTLQKNQTDITQEVLKSVEALEEQMQKIVDTVTPLMNPQVEVTFAKFFIAPAKVKGKKVSSVKFFNQEGEEIPASLKSGGKKIEVGDEVEPYEFITVTPTCLGCITFS